MRRLCASFLRKMCFDTDHSYRRLTTEERKHHKGVYSASIVFFTPRMTLNEDGVTYSINPFDALDMAEKYESYNFEERNSAITAKTVGEKRQLEANEEDDSDDEILAYAQNADGS